VVDFGVVELQGSDSPHGTHRHIFGDRRFFLVTAVITVVTKVYAGRRNRIIGRVAFLLPSYSSLIVLYLSLW